MIVLTNIKLGPTSLPYLRNPSAYEIIEPKLVGNRRKIVFGELSGKNGSAYLLSILGLGASKENAESLAKGLKELRMGDILELYLDEKLERKILNEGYVKTNKDKKWQKLVVSNVTQTSQYLMTLCKEKLLPVQTVEKVLKLVKSGENFSIKPAQVVGEDWGQ